ncbi:MAG: putative quinol monooxygenase [Pirellulaceae bacterium]
MIHVIAAISIAPGRRDDFLAEFHKLVPLVHQEQGCIEYGPTIDVPTDIPAQPAPRADMVTVVEKWESLEALKAHLVAPHMNEYRGRVKDLVQDAVIHVLEPAT